MEGLDAADDMVSFRVAASPMRKENNARRSKRFSLQLRAPIPEDGAGSTSVATSPVRHVTSFYLVLAGGRGHHIEDGNMSDGGASNKNE